MIDNPWYSRKDGLPPEFIDLLFHVKWRVPNNITYGTFFNGKFHQTKGTWESWKSADVDYWMPIPKIPEK